MRKPTLQGNEEGWAIALAHHGPMKRCAHCGQVLPSRKSFRIRLLDGRWRLQPYCHACEKLVHAESRRRRKERLGMAVGHIEDRRPIPRLELGRRYRILDPSEDGKSSEWTSYSSRVTGTCVALQGRNWVLRTPTGIRCYTAGQLVGMVIEEVA